MAEWLSPAPTASSGAVADCLLHSLLHLGLDRCRTTLSCTQWATREAALEANITKGWKISRKKRVFEGTNITWGCLNELERHGHDWVLM